MMARLTSSSAALLVLLSSVSLAQGPSGGGPGPGPVPSPWTVSGSQVSYTGCVTVPSTATGGCRGNGSGNFGSLYVNGSQVLTAATGAIIVVGTSPISGGVAGRVLYDASGVVGEYSTIPSSLITGTYSNLTGTGTLTAGATGAGFTVNLSASAISGALPDANLSSNVPLKNAANIFSASQTFTSASFSGQLTSTLATGTPPLAVSSTTKVVNLYVDRAALSDTVTTNANLTGDVTSTGNSTTLANIPGGVPVSGSLLATNVVAPGTPASGKTYWYVDSTDKRFHDKNDAGVVGTTVVPSTATTHQFSTAVSSAGLVSYAQPAFSDLSGTIGSAQFTTGPGIITSAMLANAGAATLMMNATSGSAAPGLSTVQGLTNLASPSSTLDYLVIYDHLSGTLKNVTPGAIASSSVAGVASLNSLTGALSVVAGTGISVTPSGSNITVANTGVTSAQVINGTGLTETGTCTIITTGACTLNVDVASQGNIWTAASNKMLDAATVFNSAGAVVALSGTSSVTPDLNTGLNFSFTATSATNYTLQNPTNPKVGQQGCIYLTQPASGTVVTITFGSNWVTAGGTSGKSLTATLGALDRVCYLVKTSTVIDFSLANAIAH